MVASATATALRLRGLRAETIAVGAWRVRVWRGGRPEGEPWILLHGMGATAATFLPMIAALRDDCDLVLPELSSNGGTLGPHAAIGVAEGVAVVSELLPRLFGDRPVTLAGVSLGGWIAVRAALGHPERAARLLLVVPGGYRDQDWRRIESMVRIETLADARPMWEALFTDPPWYLRPARYGFYLLYRTPTVADVIATVSEADAFGDADLARLAMPVGLVWGANDTLFRREVGERMARALPRCFLRVIAGAGHGVQWQKPREFLAALADFRAEFPLPVDRGERKIPGSLRARGGPTWQPPTT